MVENINDIWGAVVHFVDRDDRADLADALVSLAIELDASRDDLLEAAQGNTQLAKAIERIIPSEDDDLFEDD